MLTGLPEGDRFALRVAPAASTPARGVLLCLQPFMDEATLARRVLVEQARRLADQGWFTLIPDLFGTGDSGGETAAATFEIWRNELPCWAALAREQTPSGPLVLWGTRMGCLLAAQLSGLTNLPHHLLLWQPPNDGNSLLAPLRKLGRVRANAGEAAPAQPDPPHAVAPATELLAGYCLRKDLLESIAALTLCPPPHNPGASAGHVIFLSTQRMVREGQTSAPAVQDRAADWGASGWQTQTALVQGEPFWASMEPVTPLNTFAQTLEWLNGLTPAAGELACGTAPQPGNGLRPIDQSRISSRVSERTLVMEGCQGAMLGILSLPAAMSTGANPPPAALIVAGQPQTRVGSHRLFVELARSLAEQGIAVMRFDVGGWGDSPGEARPFEQSADDIAIAARTLAQLVSAGVSQSAELWVGGLCDGATAVMLALPAMEQKNTVPTGLFLLNPWVRSEASLGEAMVRTYYARRILDPAFWKRLFSGRVSLANLIGEPLRYLRAAARAKQRSSTEARETGSQPKMSDTSHAIDLPTKFINARENFTGRVITVLSGDDLTAAETVALMDSDPRWQRGLESKNGLVIRAPGADHTFSQPEHGKSVAIRIGSHVVALRSRSSGKKR